MAKKIKFFGKPMTVAMVSKIVALKIAIILMATGFGFQDWVATEIKNDEKESGIAMKAGLWSDPLKSVLAVVSIVFAISAVSFSIIHGKMHFATSLQIIASIVLSGILLALFVSDYSKLIKSQNIVIGSTEFGPGFYLQLSSTVILIIAFALSLLKHK